MQQTAEATATSKRMIAADMLILGLLCLIALVIRMEVDFEGMLDTDVINFGLAAFHFDVMQHQPHPPGYPGYVLLLKVLHLICPWLGPLELAKWGSRLCSLATIPACYVACRVIDTQTGRWDSGRRPLFCAGLASFHPLLWYYGADGQSHAAEGFFCVLLLSASLLVRQKDTRPLRLILVVMFGLAGAIRPTVPLLCAPLLVYVYWRHHLAEWLLAGTVGLLAVASWQVPTIWVSGGWDLFTRANQALLGDLFVANYSVFGSRARLESVLANINIAVYGGSLALLPLLSWSTGSSSAVPSIPNWRNAYGAVLLLTLIFFALFYVAEMGYFSGVAALACVTPATWSSRATWTTALRRIVTFMLAPLLFLVAPASLPVWQHGNIFVPGMAHIVQVEQAQLLYRQLVCEAAADQPTFVITDNPVTTHSRLVPLYCSNVLLGVHIQDLFLNRRLDNWLIFGPKTMISLPTEVPLEVGPPIVKRIPEQITQVLVTPDSSPALTATLRLLATCAAREIRSTAHSELSVFVWPSRCLPRIELGQNVLILKNES